jgi:TolB-like protein/tetratricopeptide (TPR) repeat protein
LDEARVAHLAALFDRALDVPQSQRADFVQEACGNDRELRDELSSLLVADESSAEYFEELSDELIAPAYPQLVETTGSMDRTDLLPRLQEALGSTYQIQQELGGAGMSRVFLAEEIKLGRKVVIKVLPPDMAASVSAERFRREIQVAAQLQHPHIVPLLASDSSDSLLYYTMPFVAGESLRARLARGGALPVDDATGIWRDVLDALAHAHANGVVHRDIKPANILLSGRNALVTDFGIARAIEAASEDSSLTAAGLAIGTPTYMAPEQVTGSADADHRMDIYAAGLVMYEMLEGRPAFAAASVRALVLARLTSNPAPLTNTDCPPGLAELVMRCLATDPSARPESAEAVLTELDALAKGATSTTGARATEGDVTVRPAAPGAGSRGTWRRYGLAVLAVAAVLITAAMWRRTSAENRTAAVAEPASIAVLPLANLSTDPGDAALADGMTEQLTATLGKTGNLRVIASTSVFAFERRQLSVGQIADSLGATHLLEGSFQRVGASVRMRLRLIVASDGSIPWSETYNRQMGDILAMQDDIAGAVAREVGVHLASSRRTGAASRRHAPNIVAYEWYLRGMDVALLRSDSGRRRGLEYFNRAIAIDSNFAAAYAGLVHMYLMPVGDRPERVALAEQAALKAVALDSSLAEARAGLGWAHLGRHRYAAAVMEFQRAIALDRNVPRGHEGLARAYMILGLPAEQLAAARIGLDNDPFSHSAIREYALALSVNGRCEEAIGRLRPLKELSPPSNVAGVLLGMCHSARNELPEAIRESRWAGARGSTAAPALLAHALVRSGDRDEAEAILSDLLAGRKSSNGAYGIGVVYAGLRNYDQAFVWLNKSVAEGSIRPYIMHPMFADLHRDARFALLLQRMGAQKR